ncbi:MAG: DUF503 domain-containing protein [Bacillota bacterium]|nr:DUF503 domain-containing protein [Bacillota bacterium]
MVILLINIKLRLYAVNSLKEKRSIIKSIIEKLKNKYNISISEIEYQNMHRESRIGIVAISSSFIFLEKEFDKIIKFIDGDPRIEIIDIERERI